MTVTALAYVGLGVADPAGWADFAINGIGVMDGGASGRLRLLRLDDRPWRIALHEAPDNDLLYAGFTVSGPSGLDRLRQRLDDAGVAWQDMTPPQLEQRGILAGIAARDPDGLTLEFVCDAAAVATEPFRSSRVRSFKTGAGGLGHIVLSSTDPEKSTTFFQALGFSVSDHIDMAVTPDITVRITFLHCNNRHHTVALAPIPGARRLDHLMLEVGAVDEVIDNYNRLLIDGYAMKRHLGRHPNDGVLSFYVTTPAGFDLELGCDAIEIGDQWQVRIYDRISLWGHQPDLARHGQ